MTLAQWNTVMDVNLTGQFLFAREALREFQRRGVVETVSCAAGKIDHLHDLGSSGNARKTGKLITPRQKAASSDDAQPGLGGGAHRVRVNGIAPGAIRTPINCLENARSLCQLDGARALPAYRRAGGYLVCGDMACLRRF
jgi:glucose 1-dehydrogenase